MAQPKKIYFNEQQREKILAGINESVEAQQVTLGPRGRLVCIAQGLDPKMTKDGISVLKAIAFQDYSKTIGHQLVEKASDRVAFLTGDGTTSTAVLTAEFSNRLEKLLKKGININIIKDCLDEGLENVLKELEQYRKNITDEKEIYNIAKISANNDEEIASFIVQAFKLIGDNGLVTLADSMSRKGLTDVAFSSGGRIAAGWLSNKYCNNKDNNEYEQKSPKFLLFKDPIREPDELTPFFDFSVTQKIPLVIMAPDFDDETLAMFADYAQLKKFRGILLFSPGNSVPEKEDRLRDLAVMVNAGIVGLDGLTPDNFVFDKHLGSADSITVKRGYSVIVGAHGDDEAIDNYILKLKERFVDNSEKTLSEFEKEVIQERIAYLSGGVATIRVGALTQTELQEKKDRYDDAVSQVRAAMGEGIIPGAGTPLFKISRKLKQILKNEDKSIDEKTVLDEYYESLACIAKRLVRSANSSILDILLSLMASEPNEGFNAKTNKIENLRDSGIIDPYDVVKSSVIYATKTAKLYSQIACSIVQDTPNLQANRIQPMIENDDFFGGMI